MPQLQKADLPSAKYMTRIPTDRVRSTMTQMKKPRNQYYSQRKYQEKMVSSRNERLGYSNTN